MGEALAISILAGASPMPEDVTVEQVFEDAHVTPHVVTPY